jgi:formyltetrahydrofolate deformylase
MAVLTCIAPSSALPTGAFLLQVSYRPKRKRMAVLVSKMDHCLFDLLIRQRSGELHCEIPVVISNHPDLGHVDKMFDVDYEHLGFKKELDKAVAKQQQEAAIEKVRAWLLWARELQALSS